MNGIFLGIFFGSYVGCGCRNFVNSDLTGEIPVWDVMGYD